MSYQRVSWATHYRSLKWRQGEHVLIAAPTNAGKSTLMEQLVAKRTDAGGAVVVFVSKPHDDLFDNKGFRGWKRVDRWSKVRSSDRRVLLWPKQGKSLRETVNIQRLVFREALDAIGQSKGWCVVIDELHWMAAPEFCGLAGEIAILHHQGRSSKITMICLTQRPANVPLIIYSSVTWAYVARTRLDEDVKRLSNLGGVDVKEAARELKTLPTRFDYVAFHSQGDTPPQVVNTSR